MRTPDLHVKYKQLAQEAINDSAEGRGTQLSIKSQNPEHHGGLVMVQEGPRKEQLGLRGQWRQVHNGHTLRINPRA